MLEYIAVVVVCARVICFLEVRRRRKIPREQQEKDDAENQTW